MYKNTKPELSENQRKLSKNFQVKSNSKNILITGKARTVSFRSKDFIDQFKGKYDNERIQHMRILVNDVWNGVQ